LATDVERRVRLDVGDGVAVVAFDNPEAGNALTFPMRDRLRELIRGFAAAPGVRAAVLTGAGGRWFCTGAALGGGGPARATRPADAPDGTVGETHRVMRHGWQTVIEAMLESPVPIVAAVNGTAAGGGAQLVLASDVVIAADDARLIEVFVRRGLVPDAGASYLLPRLVGLLHAKELLFSGDAITGAQMARIGLANRAVPRSEVLPTARSWASRLADLPTDALAAAKRLLVRSLDSDRAGLFSLAEPQAPRASD